ncbi:MAG: hypothetical protein HY368_00095 [Candidatus Aenigmarchaeota archaeon]|nr:hypothetical protein [Candidatus Aenigmarchaeota archaeon]
MRPLSALVNYISDIVLIAAALLIYRSHSYYLSFLRPETHQALLALSAIYALVGLPYYVYVAGEDHRSKGLVVFSWLRNGFRNGFYFPGREKTVVLFLVVKFFFLPIMINFAIDNYYAVSYRLPELLSGGDLLSRFNNNVYPFLLPLIFLIDTLYFAFGYAAEAAFLKNKVKSVEPTFLGWAVALTSYPPFNSAAGHFFQWGADDFAYFGSMELTFAVRLFIVFLLSVYLSATLALGTKCSNLTNRGIVSRGPYRHIRHPAYASKVASWWMLALPAMNPEIFLGMGFWTVIYLLRSVTEERHLSADPDYAKYRKQVPYMFVPRVV